MKKFAIVFSVLVFFVSCIINTSTGKLHLLDTLLDNQFVVSLAIADDGTAWTGIIRDQYGLVRIDPDGSTEIFDHTNSCLTDSANIWDIEIDSQGKIWMLNDDGLICYNGDTFTRYDSIDNFYIPKAFENLLAIDHDDNIWFIGYNPWVNCPTQRIFSFDGENFLSYEPNGMDLDMGPILSDIEIDRSGNVWFSFRNDDPVFLKYNAGEWASYDSTDIGFAPYNIADIEFDSDNNLWFNDDITFSSSIQYYENYPGLYCFDGEHEANTYGDMYCISQVSVDEHDNVWVCGFSPRLAVLDINRKWVSNNSDDVGFCRVMETGPNGEMWVGTSTGIMIYRYGQTK